MRYLQYVVHSPRLLWELLLTLIVAAAIGGTGLAGLHTARNALSTVSNTRMPVLASILETERDIAQMNYYGLASVIDISPQQRAQVEFPKMRAFGQAAQQSFRAFQAAGSYSRAEKDLADRISQRLQTAVALADLSDPLNRLLNNLDAGKNMMAVGETLVAVPLTEDLTQLARIEQADVTRTSNSAGTQADAASGLLLGVIVVLVMAIGVLRVGVSVRTHLRRALGQQSADVVLLLDACGAIRYTSPMVEPILGYRQAEVLGRNVLEFIHPADHEAVRAGIARRLDNGPERVEVECRARHADGSFRWLAAAGVNRLGDPLVRSLVVTGRDITTRKQAEAALRATEGHLRAVISHAPMLLLAIDEKGIVTLSEGDGGLGEGSARTPSVGQHLGDRIAGLPQIAQLWQRVVAGESFSARLDTTANIFDVWWTAEVSSDGEVLGGSGIAVNATETVRAQHEAQRVRQAALELGQMRNDFVASVSHELRTPLTSIIGYGEILEAHWERLTEPERRSRLGKMVTAANRQKRLVEDLLLLTRLDDILPAEQLESVDVQTVVQRVAGEAQGTYPGQRIDTDGPAGLHVLGHPDRVTQILANMVDNAAKYSPEGSPIAITWSLDHRDVLIRVRDAGPGIPEESRSHLFTRFGRIPGSPIRAGRVGTGLGLYVGRQLARAMGGELDLDATGPRGSTFCLRLPQFHNVRVQR